MANLSDEDWEEVLSDMADQIDPDDPVTLEQLGSALEKRDEENRMLDSVAQSGENGSVLDPKLSGFDHDFNTWPADEVGMVRATDAAPYEANAVAPVESRVQVRREGMFEQEVMYTFSVTLDAMEVAASHYNEERTFTVNGNDVGNRRQLVDRLTDGFLAAYMREPPLYSARHIVVSGRARYDSADGDVGERRARGGGTGTDGVVYDVTKDNVRKAIREKVSQLLTTVGLSDSGSNASVDSLTLYLSLDGVRTGAGAPNPFAEPVEYRAWYNYFALALGGRNPTDPKKKKGHHNLDRKMFCPCLQDNRCFYHCLLRAAGRASENDTRHIKTDQYGYARDCAMAAALGDLRFSLCRRSSTSHQKLEDKLLRSDKFGFDLRGAEACVNNRPVGFDDVFEAALVLRRPIVTFALDDNMKILPEFSVMWWELKQVLERCPENMTTGDKLVWFCQHVRTNGRINLGEVLERKNGHSVFTNVDNAAPSTKYTPGMVEARSFVDHPDPTTEDPWSEAMKSTDDERVYWLGKRTVTLGYSAAWRHFILFTKIQAAGTWIREHYKENPARYSGVYAWKNQKPGSVVCLTCGQILNKPGKHPCTKRRCCCCFQVLSTRREYARHAQARYNDKKNGRVKTCRYCLKIVSQCCHRGHEERACVHRKDGEATEGSTMVRCTRCFLKFPAGDAFQTHIQTCQGQARVARCKQCNTKHSRLYQPCRIGPVEKTSKKKWESTEVYVWDIESAADGPERRQVPNYVHVRRLPKPRVEWQRDPVPGKPKAEKPFLKFSNQEQDREQVEGETKEQRKLRLGQKQVEREASQELAKEENQWSFDSLPEFLEWVFDRDRDSVFIAHNSKGYDSFLLRTAALECGHRPDFECSSGQKIDSIGFSREVELVSATGEGTSRTATIRYKFIDSLNWIQKPLSKLPKTLGVQEAKAAKDLFPHDFHTTENQNYEGLLPDREHWGDISDADWEQLCARYATTVNEAFDDEKPLFNLREYMTHYCKKDTFVLAMAMVVWRFKWLYLFNIDPLLHSTTAASLAMHVYRSNFVSDDSAVTTLTRFHEEFARQAYAGGRTEPFTLVMGEEHGILYYFDVTSLYPTVMFFDKLPFGPPTTYVSDEFLAKMGADERSVYEANGYKGMTDLPDNWEEQEGIVQLVARTKPAHDLPDDYVPPIGVRGAAHNGHASTPMDRKFVFGLMQEPHLLVKTMVEYRLMRDDPAYEIMAVERVDLMGHGTTNFFADYIREIYRIKERNSEPPKTEEAKDRLVEECNRIGIPITRQEVKQKENKGMRAVAKILLNSLYGKFGQRTLPTTEYMTTQEYTAFLRQNVIPHPFRYRLISRTISEAPPGKPATVCVKYLDLRENRTLGRTNVAVAAYITAYARLRLYAMLRDAPRIGCQLAYCDTDSVVFCDPQRRSHAQLAQAFKDIGSSVEIGDVLGKWKAEYEEGKEDLLECVQVAAKTYAHRVWNHEKGKETFVIKSKGMPVRGRKGRKMWLESVDPETGETSKLFDICGDADWFRAYKEKALNPPGTRRVVQTDANTFVRKHGEISIVEGTKAITRTGKDKRVFDEANPSMPSAPHTLLDQPESELPAKKAKATRDNRGDPMERELLSPQFFGEGDDDDDDDGLPPLTLPPSHEPLTPNPEDQEALNQLLDSL